jgi:hypothetical protein
MRGGCFSEPDFLPYYYHNHSKRNGGTTLQAWYNIEFPSDLSVMVHGGYDISEKQLKLERKKILI